MADYFAAFALFVQRPTAPLKEEFVRLAETRKWEENGKRYHKEWKKLLRMESERLYEVSDASSLEGWQGLCQEIGIMPVPPTITQCRKALSNVHVNLIDLIDARRAGQPFSGPRFKSVGELRSYARKEHKIFPKVDAKKDSGLKQLLRKLIN